MLIETERYEFCFGPEAVQVTQKLDDKNRPIDWGTDHYRYSAITVTGIWPGFNGLWGNIKIDGHWLLGWPLGKGGERAMQEIVERSKLGTNEKEDSND